MLQCLLSQLSTTRFLTVARRQFRPNMTSAEPIVRRLKGPTLIYEAPPDQQKMQRFFGLMMMALAGSSFLVTFNSLRMYEFTSRSDSRAVRWFTYSVPFLTGIVGDWTMMPAGLTALAFAFIYPNRIVRSLTLLPQSRMVLHTYGVFGRAPDTASMVTTRDIELRSAKLGLMRFQVRGQPFDYRLYFKDAVFHDRDHFDRIFSGPRRNV